MAILEIEGARLAYDEFGKETKGGHVVFIHGFPLNRTMWEKQVDAFRGAYHVIAPDMRGHGSSDVPEGAISMERMADDVHALVTSLGAESIVLVGLSMGGYVALEFARKYGPLLRGLVLADTKATSDSEEARAGRVEMVKLVSSEGAAAVGQALLPKLFSEKAAEADPDLVVKIRRMIETTSAAGIAAAVVGMADRRDSSDVLATIGVPTLVLVGSHDVVTPVAEAEAMMALLPNAHLTVIEGAGHLSNLEKVEPFNAALKEFLGQLAPAIAVESAK